MMSEEKSKCVECTSYANVALVKYWGKEDEQAVIPSTSSISLTLEALYTRTQMEFAPRTSRGDEVLINDMPASPAETARVSAFIDDFVEACSPLFDSHGMPAAAGLASSSQRAPRPGVRVRSYNSMPTAAGLASSSSGMSALALACNTLFEAQLDLQTLAQITKRGSGSACRSLYGPVVAWDRHSSRVFKLETRLRMAMIIVIISDQRKSISSREAMRRCRTESPGFDQWVRSSDHDFTEMQELLRNNDFQGVGEIAEANALRMHELPLQCQPPFSYLSSESHRVIEEVRALRAQGESCYATMDAGANVKVLCLEEDLERLNKHFATRYRTICSKAKTL